MFCLVKLSVQFHFSAKMEGAENGQATNGEPVKEKTPKQLKKEGEKAAKLEKFKAKQEKIATVEPAKPSEKKKEVAAKPKAAEVESM